MNRRGTAMVTAEEEAIPEMAEKGNDEKAI
jgi:hypothetical protein